MVIDLVLARFRDALNMLVQPTDNAFAHISEFAKKWHQGLDKIVEFTKEVLTENAKTAKKVASGKEVKKKDEEVEAEKELDAKLDQCYKFRDELADLASVPAPVVRALNNKMSIQSDTPPEIQQLLIRLLLATFNRFLETVNNGDARNEPARAAKDPLPFMNPRERAIAKKMAEGKAAVEAGNAKTAAKGQTPKIRKTVTRTLTRRR